MTPVSNTETVTSNGKDTVVAPPAKASKAKVKAKAPTKAKSKVEAKVTVKAKAPKVRAGKYLSTAKIKLLTDNPHHKGTTAYKTYERLKALSTKTVGEAKKVNVGTGYLNHMVAREVLSITA